MWLTQLSDSLLDLFGIVVGSDIDAAYSGIRTDSRGKSQPDSKADEACEGREDGSLPPEGPVS